MKLKFAAAALGVGLCVSALSGCQDNSVVPAGQGGTEVIQQMNGPNAAPPNLPTGGSGAMPGTSSSGTSGGNAPAGGGH